MANSDDAEIRKIAIKNMSPAATFRTMRSMLQPQQNLRKTVLGAALSTKPQRMVYTLRNAPLNPYNLPGTLARAEGQKPTGDPAVDEAYDGSGKTFDFFNKLFGRNSLDGRGMPLISTVHADENFTNAFWNGQQMVYGDGDGQAFIRFTASLDVIAHELTHGVVSNECDLIYNGQPGALNEHFADAFGTMVRQWVQNETFNDADWLIGKDILTQAPTRKAIRSMAAPGTAFQDDPFLGTDPQPAHMSKLYTEARDRGGVHINSGIPNHAFYLAAKEIGGYSWKTLGPIWYATMRALHNTADFAEMASTSRMIANSMSPGPIAKAVDSAWTQVGL